jgi:peroxiredoxin
MLMLGVAGAARAEIPYVVGDTIADFTLYDAYGTPVSLYDYQNTVILLDFWADW